MTLESRKVIDKSFLSVGYFSILLLAIILGILLIPIFYKGIGAIVFRGTIEFRKVQNDKFHRGNQIKLQKEINQIEEKRQVIYEALDNFDKELKKMPYKTRKKYKKDYKTLKNNIKDLFGSPPNEKKPVLMRMQYGETRWDKAKEKLTFVLNKEKWVYPEDADSYKIFIPYKKVYSGTSLEHIFTYIEDNFDELMKPKLTIYWGFFTDESYDSHFFGGIFPEILGTIYLTIFAMLFAIPLGIIAAIYLTEFAKEGIVISFIRICISTLAGVPSIVFGLFGLAFFINTIKVSDSKSVIAGSMTLALLILPTIIRSTEEALRAVPKTYKEASLSLGATKLKTILTIILPASLPGIITGIIISMGRAAGETAPIIFTAAVSVGKPLKIFEIFSNPTPALSWNIYNLTTEHEAVDQIRHVQYGMVFTLIMIVLILNLSAIIIRGRISKKLRG